ncbi:MAG TPA: ABC transporter ATP-binding protein [Acidimicrobiales bacterium]|nr:ABC transporter ATP-binding protein [Acidimicrobiales bacterium]
MSNAGAGHAVEANDLVVRYGALTAVDGLSFSAEHGEIVGLLGPNGAGKTSTIEALEGFRPVSSGSARVLGKNPATQMREIAPDIGVMLQQGGVYPSMSPTEALALFASYYPAPNDPGALLERLGLGAAAGTAWKRLSGGEQRLLSLALAIVGRPKVAFLDEPTAGVDPDGRSEVRALVRELAASGTCVLLASHDLDEVEDLADRVLIIDRGRLIAEGSPRGLTDRPQEIRFTAPPGLDKPALAAAMGGTVTESTPGSYRLVGEVSPERVERLVSWLAARGVLLLELRTGGESLREAFARLVDHRA